MTASKRRDDVPVVAGEERTADSLAVVLSILSDRRGADLPLGIAALQTAAAERNSAPAAADYADDHGLDRQRAFDAICAVYGSYPERQQDLLRGPHALPESRAQLCPFDYERAVEDWRRLLERYLTDAGALLPPGL